MKLVRKLGFDSVRGYCISRNLYTNGCNEEYTALYEFITSKNNKLNDEDLLYVAEDIYNHSITDLYVEDIFTGLNHESYYEKEGE